MKTLKRDAFEMQVAARLDGQDSTDLPLIRQTINDTADEYRKHGWSVRDFAQDRMVAQVQLRMRRQARKHSQAA